MTPLNGYIFAGVHQEEPLSPILCLGVNPFPSRYIYGTALKGGFARTQFKDPIKIELDRVYCFKSHSPMIKKPAVLKIKLLGKGLT